MGAGFGTAKLNVDAGAVDGIINTTSAANSKAVNLFNSTLNKSTFVVLGDGNTTINTANNNALTIADAANPTNIRFNVEKTGKLKIASTVNEGLEVGDATTSQTNFIVTKSGNTFIGGGISAIANSQLVVASPVATGKVLNLVNSNNLSNIQDVFSVYGDGLAEIRAGSYASSNNKALSIRNVFNGEKETFVVENNGYTEIKVYNPSNMPTPYSNGKRAFTIRDASLGAEKVTVLLNE